MYIYTRVCMYVLSAMCSSQLRVQRRPGSSNSTNSDQWAEHSNLGSKKPLSTKQSQDPPEDRDRR